MITRRTRSLSVGFAALGMLSLAGCAIQTAAAIPGTGSGPGSTATRGSYADGTYTVDAGYQAPSGTESITVELGLSGGVVSSVRVSADATDHEARQYQQAFASAISAEVVGKDISSLSVTRVAGASLTSNGFNSALDQIRSHAA